MSLRRFRAACYHIDRMKYREPKIKYQFQPPAVPRRRWCDFRCDFESGMTLKSIGEKYHCDQRTVRRCILLNKNSTDLGRQYAPTKLAPYIQEIDILFNQCMHRLSIGGKPCGITQLSRQIMQEICKKGYTGSIRLIQNHLRSKYELQK